MKENRIEEKSLKERRAEGRRLRRENLEGRLRFAEGVLERLGAVPQPINEKNRELLGQRSAYLLNGIYYRIDREEYEGKVFIVLSAADEEKYAAVGLMEEIQAFSADASDETVRKKIREALS